MPRLATSTEIAQLLEMEDDLLKSRAKAALPPSISQLLGQGLELFSTKTLTHPNKLTLSWIASHDTSTLALPANLIFKIQDQLVKVPVEHLFLE